LDGEGLGLQWSTGMQDEPTTTTKVVWWKQKQKW
jgi:hypothetical protein